MRNAMRNAVPFSLNRTAPGVLLASPDWALRELLRLLLEDRGYNVRKAAGKLDALELIETARDPLIVVLDLASEDTTALDLLRAARDHMRCLRHEYILLAPPKQPLPCDVWPLIEALSIPVLCKPLDLDELFEIVNLLSVCLCGEPSSADSLSF